MKASTKEDLLLHEVQVLQYAEDQIHKALPRLAEAASSPELKAIIDEGVQRTRRVKTHLGELFRKAGGEPVAGQIRAECISMNAMLQETEKVIQARLEPDALDTELGLGVQRISQYQASGYRAVQSYAESLGYHAEAQSIKKIIDEDEATSKRLSQLSADLVK
jgi:ferritin-like metal-binding protein YciE